MDEHSRVVEESRHLANRMRQGTGASTLLHAQDAPTHQMDSLQRFQKDFASFEKHRRDEEKTRRQSELERRRIQQLERESKRWELVQNYQKKLKEREDAWTKENCQLKWVAWLGYRLAYNPITLEYDRNPEGQKLKRLDEDTKIRGYVRAHNMDNKGNSNYNPLTGQNRIGIEAVIPQQLTERFQHKKFQHYDNLRLKVPSANSHGRPHSYSQY